MLHPLYAVFVNKLDVLQYNYNHRICNAWYSCTIANKRL